MNKIAMILRNEIMTLVRRPSFWFGVLGVPVISLLVYLGVSILNRSAGVPDGAPNPINHTVGQLMTPKEDARPQGYVDLAFIVEKYLARKSSYLIGYANIKDAQSSLDQGAISAYYVIPEDYLLTGKLFVYAPEYNLVVMQSRSADLRQLITYNLLGGDSEQYDVFTHPVNTEDLVSLAPPDKPVRDKSSGLTFALPYAVMTVFFIGILGSATLMLNSLTKEKENRVIEILLLSATPHQLLLGKISGLGLVGLFQVMVWFGSGFALLQVSGQEFNLPPAFLLHPSILAWAVLFFLLGYLLYATLMAGVGALVPNLREASQATFILTLPLMAPIFLLSVLVERPDGLLAVLLSLFPFTAPVTMMMRLSTGDVPLWQILLSTLLLITAGLLVIRVVAGLFRAQTLLSGQGFQLGLLFRRGKFIAS